MSYSGEFETSVGSVNSVGANDELRVVSGNVGIGVTGSIGGKLHLSSHESGDCVLLLESDVDNNATNDNPFVLFKQSGTVDSAVAQGNKDFGIYNSVSSGGGIRFLTGTTPIWYNAIERMRIDPLGAVGIGMTANTTPLAKLQVDGNLLLGDTWAQAGNQSVWGPSNSQLILGGSHNANYNVGDKCKLLITGYDNENNTGVVYPIIIEDENSRQDFFVKSYPAGEYNSTTYIGGNLGIGTKTPNSALHVYGIIDNTPDTKGIHMGHIYNNTNRNALEFCGSVDTMIDFTTPGVDMKGRIYYHHSSAYMTFHTDTTERLRISSTGNVGIGSGSATAGKFNLYTSFSVPSLNGLVSTNNNAGIDFYTGQSSSWNGSGIYSQSITPAVGARIWHNPATYDEVGSGHAGHHGRLYLTCGHDAAASDNPGICVMSTGHVGIGYNYGSVRLVVNGQTYSSSGYLSSDDRIKYNEQVIDTSLALNLINQLTPQKYEKIIEEPSNASGNWIPTDAEWISKRDEKIIGTDGSETNVWKWEIEAGIIAQDIRSIPELAFCVKGNEIDENGKQEPLRLDYNNLYAYHISATKELTTQLNAEKVKTATLENDIALIKAHLNL